MLGRLLGHSPGLWQRVALPVLHPTRAAGSKAKNAQDVALQTADPGGWKVFGHCFVLQHGGKGYLQEGVRKCPSFSSVAELLQCFVS